MGPIQDVAPPKAESADPLAGPELVHDIPVRQHASNTSTDPDSNFVIAEPEPSKQGFPKLDFVGKPAKNHAGDKPKASAGMPWMVGIVFTAAAVCLIGGAYLKFLS